MAFMRGRIRPPKGGEHRTRFNPATANGVRTSLVYHGRATQRFCIECKSWFNLAESAHCMNPECVEKLQSAHPQGVRLIDPDKAISGWYEHIGSKPIYIESRKQLYNECLRHGVSARALMSGGVMKRPRGA